MGNRIFYWFILAYTLIVIYDGFYEYIFKSKDEVISEAIVGSNDYKGTPIFKFQYKNQVFNYEDKYVNKYLFVNKGDVVKIKYKLNLNQNYITDVKVIDFRYQLFSIDKIIYHVIILLISYLSIHKIYSDQ